MDNSAIQAIRDLAVTAQTNDVLDLSDLKSLIVIPEQHKLIDLEKYQEIPIRFRGLFSTSLLAEFINYVNANADSATGIFIDPKNSSANAILDMGSPGKQQWGEHKTSLTLKKTPEFEQLLQLKDVKLNQQDMIDFFEDWPDAIQFIDDNHDELDFKKSLNAIRRLSVSVIQNSKTEIGNFNASQSSIQSSMDQIEVKEAGIKPPFGFIFHVAPYESFSQYRLTCQLRTLTDGKTVSLKYRITSLNNELDNINLEFMYLLKKSLTNEDVMFYIGTMQYQVLE